MSVNGAIDRNLKQKTENFPKIKKRKLKSNSIKYIKLEHAKIS